MSKHEFKQKTALDFYSPEGCRAYGSARGRILDYWNRTYGTRWRQPEHWIDLDHPECVDIKDLSFLERNVVLIEQAVDSSDEVDSIRAYNRGIEYP